MTRRLTAIPQQDGESPALCILRSDAEASFPRLAVGQPRRQTPYQLRLSELLLERAHIEFLRAGAPVLVGQMPVRFRDGGDRAGL